MQAISCQHTCCRHPLLFFRCEREYGVTACSNCSKACLPDALTDARAARFLQLQLGGRDVGGGVVHTVDNHDFVFKDALLFVRLLPSCRLMADKVMAMKDFSGSDQITVCFLQGRGCFDLAHPDT